MACIIRTYVLPLVIGSILVSACGVGGPVDSDDGGGDGREDDFNCGRSAASEEELLQYISSALAIYEDLDGVWDLELAACGYMATQYDEPTSVQVTFITDPSNVGLDLDPECGRATAQVATSIEPFFLGQREVAMEDFIVSDVTMTSNNFNFYHYAGASYSWWNSEILTIRVFTPEDVFVGGDLGVGFEFDGGSFAGAGCDIVGWQKRP